MDRGSAAEGWFHGIALEDLEAAVSAIGDGSADAPRPWPALAVEAGLAPDETSYYASLRDAAVAAAEQEVRERSAAGDEQLKHQIRALDDIERVANELAERLAEWATVAGIDIDPGVESVVALAGREPTTAGERRIASLAGIVAALDTERDALRRDIERGMHDVAPNLSALAGPLLGARLISLAGSLEAMAKLPSGTVQVLGAEDALFAHLNAGAPPPKHGLIYTHEFVRGTALAERGSAARALAGKLAIAARIDHYAGDLRPELEVELQERIDRIRGEQA